MKYSTNNPFIHSIFFSLILLVIPVFVPVCHAVPEEPADKTITLKVMTINIRHNKDFWQDRFPMIADEIVRLDPDLIGLQEVMISEKQAQYLLELIGERRGGEPGYHMAEKLKTGFSGIAGEGIAVFSRFPIEKKAFVDLEYGRPGLFARAKVSDRLTVDLINTHLHNKGGDPLKLGQAKKIVEFADKMDAGNIQFLVGDMNSKADYKTIRHFLDNSFIDTYLGFHGDEKTLKDGSTAPVVMAKNNPQQDFRNRIDYVFFRVKSEGAPQVTITDSIVCFKNHSEEGLYPTDHLGVMTTFRIDFK